MPVGVERTEIDRFRALVAQRLGLAFDDGKSEYLADVLRGRVEACGFAQGAPYIGRLAGAADWREEWRVLAENLTVAETYFFRYWDHFRAFAEVVLPSFARREIRILSAGCASGEEAYSLAILVRERLPEFASAPVRIRGIDVNPSMIQKALRARYSAWSLRETPSDLRDRNFRVDGREIILNDAVRSMVTFEERNLIEPDPVFWQPGAFDVVFCRNVTMYFSPEIAKAVIARIAHSLTPDGFLFLGHAETLRGVSDEFHLRHTHETFYYQRRGDSEPRSLPASSATPVVSKSVDGSTTSLVDSSGSWMEVIQRASQRIEALAIAPGTAEASPAPPLPPRTWDLGVIFDLLRKERFSDAMKLLAALPAESNKDPDTQLLRAVILTNSGDLKGAKSACHQVLDSDELNSGAHYLMALCLEHEGDRRPAVEHNQTAAYLDPSFAMPRFHLGLLAKREGDLGRARHELDQALTLLAREDSSRILLFGGGFSRDALVELCRAELRSCGGAP